MSSGQVFRPHFASPLHPWLGTEKGVVGASSPSWHSPFTKPAHYSHSSTSPTPHSNSYSSYASSGLFSAFAKDEGMGGAAGGANHSLEYQMGGGGTTGDSGDMKAASMLSPLSACTNKSGREGLAYSSPSMGVTGSGGGSVVGEASTPLLPSYPHYPGSLPGASEFHNPYYPTSAHFNKAMNHEKPKNKSRSSAGKITPVVSVICDVTNDVTNDTLLKKK